MSVLPHRVGLFRAMNVFLCTAILISNACHRAPSTAPRPKIDRSRHYAGVDIVPTAHAGFIVKIHSAMVGDGEPLYVIDGTRMRMPANRGIDWFKPEDILEIKVLKYPHELMEYGPNGVNGVIVITTKQGRGRS
jgi:hypothetical protein